MAKDAAIIDPLMHGLRSKGLKKGSVSRILPRRDAAEGTYLTVR